MAYFLIIVVETKALVQAALAPGSDPITLFKAITECNLAIHIGAGDPANRGGPPTPDRRSEKGLTGLADRQGG